jgi:hypothetical protein
VQLQQGCDYSRSNSSKLWLAIRNLKTKERGTGGGRVLQTMGILYKLRNRRLNNRGFFDEKREPGLGEQSVCSDCGFAQEKRKRAMIVVKSGRGTL